jgi:hypothetical protein
MLRRFLRHELPEVVLHEARAGDDDNLGCGEVDARLERLTPRTTPSNVHDTLTQLQRGEAARDATHT